MIEVKKLWNGRCWHVNGTLHREDGPVVEYSNGSKWWFLNGVRHRLDGPAIEQVNGIKQFWVNGIEYSELEFKFWFPIDK